MPGYGDDQPRSAPGTLMATVTPSTSTYSTAGAKDTRRWRDHSLQRAILKGGETRLAATAGPSARSPQVRADLRALSPAREPPGCLQSQPLTPLLLGGRVPATLARRYYSRPPGHYGFNLVSCDLFEDQLRVRVTSPVVLRKAEGRL